MYDTPRSYGGTAPLRDAVRYLMYLMPLIYTALLPANCTVPVLRHVLLRTVTKKHYCTTVRYCTITMYN